MPSIRKSLCQRTDDTNAAAVRRVIEQQRDAEAVTLAQLIGSKRCENSGGEPLLAMSRGPDLPSGNSKSLPQQSRVVRLPTRKSPENPIRELNPTWTSVSCEWMQ